MVKRVEGAEKPLTKDDYVSTVRGGQKIEYFFNYPHPSGTWARKLEHDINSP